MNAIEMLQNSFQKNLPVEQKAVESKDPIDQRKVAIAQNKQQVLQTISQGPTGAM